MTMKKLMLLAGIILCCAFTQQTEDGGLCGLPNTAYAAGESLNFTVYYSVAGLYFSAGKATVNTTITRYNNKTVYHINCEGRSSSSYDWIFKVRDRYETFIDTNTMLPLRFIRNIHEGSYKKHEDIVFNHENGTAATTKGTYKIPHCIQDVVSGMFNVRNIDFNKYRINDRIPFQMFLDNEVYNLYIRYLGKEKVTTRFGTFNAIKFKPLLIQGEIFKGGEDMVVWMSDDANHLPLRVESPITVGSIKVDMMGFKNLRHPLSSRLK